MREKRLGLGDIGIALKTRLVLVTRRTDLPRNPAKSVLEHVSTSQNRHDSVGG
jgi:hypothetical protein